MATRGTVGSDKFARLLGSVQGQAQFEVCACNGLALAIEQTTLPSHQSVASVEVSRLLQSYTQAMGRFGQGAGEIDTLVLGCTHYVFAQDELQRLVGPQVQLVSTGEPVARQTQRLLESAHLLRHEPAPRALGARIELFTTGNLPSLKSAAQRWLKLPAQHCHRVNVL
jgi:glutamate racemase